MKYALKMSKKGSEQMSIVCVCVIGERGIVYKTIGGLYYHSMFSVLTTKNEKNS